MKKFVSQIALFLILPFLICVLILISPLKRKFAWNSLPTDCEGRGAWIYNRLYSDTTPVDMAFLGTSHTINGIQDTALARLFETQIHQKVNVLNLGYCRFGNEMQFVIAKDLFATKKPRIVFIEINNQFGVASHPVYPYYAETENLLQPASFVQQTYPANIYNGFLARLSQCRNTCFGAKDSTLVTNLSYGYRGYPDPVDSAQLIPAEKNQKHEMNSWKRLQAQYPQAWLSDLIDLCKQNNTQVCFIYLPSFHDPAVPIEGMDFYTSLTDVLLPPDDFLKNKTFWRDPDHLNDKGAAFLAQWISEVAPVK